MPDLTDHTSSIENITSQIHDVILQAAEPCKKKIQLSEHCSSLKQLQWYDTDCSNIRHEYNRLRNTYNRSKDIKAKLKRDYARTNYKSICKLNSTYTRINKQRPYTEKNIKIQNRIGRKLSKLIKKLRQKSLVRVLKNISNHYIHPNHLYHLLN